MGSGGGSKHGDKSFDRILDIVIIDLLMNLISCIYLPKGFTILECNDINLEKIPNEKKTNYSFRRNK